jgi:hypothetical protein
VPGLRAQETLFLEDEAGADEEAADDGEDDADDLGGVSVRRGGGGRGTLRLEGSWMVVPALAAEEVASLASSRGDGSIVEVGVIGAVAVLRTARRTA